MKARKITEATHRERLDAIDVAVRLKAGDRVRTPKGDATVHYHMEAGWVVCIKRDGYGKVDFEYAINVEPLT